MLFICVGITVISSIGNNEKAYAQFSGNINDKGHKVGFYGCEKSNNSTVRCNPLNNKTESYEIAGISSKLYNLTREPTFIDTTHGKALEMRATYLESIKFSNNPVANPTNFSVSFWIKNLPEYENTYGHVFSHSSVYTKEGWHFDMSKMANASGQALGFSVYGNGGKLYSSATVPVSNDVFTHIVGTVDGSSIKIF